MADQKAILKAGDQEVELPILSGTAGHDVIDVRALGASGYFTFDPWFHGHWFLRICYHLY